MKCQPGRSEHGSSGEIAVQAWLRGAAASVCALLLGGSVRLEQVAEESTALGIRACVTLTPKARGEPRDWGALPLPSIWEVDFYC